MWCHFEIFITNLLSYSLSLGFSRPPIPLSNSPNDGKNSNQSQNNLIMVKSMIPTKPNLLLKALIAPVLLHMSMLLQAHILDLIVFFFFCTMLLQAYERQRFLVFDHEDLNIREVDKNESGR